MKIHVLAAVLFAAAVTPAAAYTSYVKPNEFWVVDPAVQVEGSFATQFFTPSIALGDTLTVLNPEGQRVAADRISVTAAGTTELQAELARGGTYRISTGEVAGQVANLVGENGAWRVLGAGEAPAEGAQTTTLQTITVADAYVTRGTANRTAVDQNIGRLALHPVTHPNQILVSQGFQVQVLFDGQPLANTAVTLYGAGDSDTDQDQFVVTDASGVATFTFDAAGNYIIAARYRADMPAGSPAAVGSYTTTLTFEALDQLHAETEIRDAQSPEQRRRRPARRSGVGRL